MTVHSWNWYFGWSLVLSGFATGAGLGLFFHQPDFLGGYSSFRRQIIRLGHISQAALGMMNVLYAVSPWPLGGTYAASLAGTCFTIGGISMPTVCFLTGWQERFRHLFFIPVIALMLAIAFTLMGGPP